MQSFTPRLLATYALGLLPGLLLMAFVPHGEHVSYVPLALGLSVGLGLWLLTRRLAPHRAGDQNHGLLLAILLPYQLWTGHVLLAFVNRGLDRSPPEVHELRVLELEKRTKGNDRIVLEHWRAGEDSFQVEGHYEPGTQLRVTTHAGRLGFEWVEIEGPTTQAFLGSPKSRG